MKETLGVTLARRVSEKQPEIEHTLKVIESKRMYLLELVAEVVSAIEPYEGGTYKLSGTPIAPKGHEAIDGWEMEVVKAGFATPDEFEHYERLAIVRATLISAEVTPVYCFDPYQDRSFDIQPIDIVE
jgi:hypothetical protein